MNTYSLKPAGGYVALISSLILGALLGIVAFAANRDAFLAREALTDEESYRQAFYAGESCIDLAMHMLSVDTDRFGDGEPVTIPISAVSSCTIQRAEVLRSSASVIASGHSKESYIFLTASGERTGSGSSVHFVTTHIQRKRTLSTP